MKYRQSGSKGPVISTVGFGAWGISGRDWGTSDGENDHRRFNLSPEKLTAYLIEYDAYKSLFEKYPGCSSAQLSLRFCISHPACHVVIPGGKNPNQVKENVLASELDFITFETFAQ